MNLTLSPLQYCLCHIGMLEAAIDLGPENRVRRLIQRRAKGAQLLSAASALPSSSSAAMTAIVAQLPPAIDGYGPLVDLLFRTREEESIHRDILDMPAEQQGRLLNHLFEAARAHSA